MATELIESMSVDWNPDDYHDEFRDRLTALIEERVASKGAKTKIEEGAPPPEHAATNVVDFMSLLKKSLESKQRTPAKKAPPKKRASAAKKAPAKRKGPAKAKPGKKPTSKKQAG
jgi:DNA end-binding protein Ku